MRRRFRLLVGLSVAALAGVVLVCGTTAWVLWRQSIQSEQAALSALAKTLGQRTERIMTDARDTLESLNQLAVPPCSDAHLEAMDRAAVGKPEIVSIGYWNGAHRKCGSGFTDAVQLKPPQADRIYESGVIAWWPSSHTQVAGVQLFLMRYGRHDVAIDPRMLLKATPVEGRALGLWVDEIRMASQPSGAQLPEPASVSQGTSLTRDDETLVSHFRFDQIFPIDIVVREPIDRFWSRHWMTFLVASTVALALAAIWLYGVIRYSRHRLSLVAELREALAHGRITAQYQPVIDLDSGHCVGAETLARWTRDTGESMSPDAFVPLAERAGLVSEITLAALATSVHDLGDLLRENPDLRINLNLTPEDLESPAFSRRLAQCIEAEGIACSNIKLEITERSLVNSEKARAFVDALREQGHEIAIDDFGTGYSSLSYLEKFNLDTLKIDKAFVSMIDADSTTNNVVSHIIDMAHSMGLKIVAEGVETVEQADWLKRHGVEFAQGFLFSEALPPRQFRAFLRAQQRSNVYPLSRVRPDSAGMGA